MPGAMALTFTSPATTFGMKVLIKPTRTQQAQERPARYGEGQPHDAAVRRVRLAHQVGIHRGGYGADCATRQQCQQRRLCTLSLATLAAGRYRLTLVAASNDANGNLLSQGYTYDGQTPIPLALWNQPSYDPNANDQKGGYWQLHASGVDAVAAVPEPAAGWLMFAGLAGQALAARRSDLGRHGGTPTQVVAAVPGWSGSRLGASYKPCTALTPLASSPPSGNT